MSASEVNKRFLKATQMTEEIWPWIQVTIKEKTAIPFKKRESSMNQSKPTSIKVYRRAQSIKVLISLTCNLW